MSLNFENIVNGMRVVLVKNDGLAARIGATATVLKEHSNGNWIYIEWDKNDEFISRNLDRFQQGVIQQDGAYYYEQFVAFDSIEGQEVLKREGRLKNSIEEITTNLDVYCNCQSPSLKMSYAGIGPQATPFLFCHSCKKEKLNR